MNQSFKIIRCLKCHKLFNSFGVKDNSYCSECFNPFIPIVDYNCDSLIEDDYNEGLLKSELLMLSDYLMSDKMGEALFLLGRIIGNLENGEYIH